jgi:Glycosyltransferases involved in cell wall biogenesis
MALVSIIMPVYNTAPFLRQAIESVVAQTHQDWELLVVDDGSTDGSGEIIRELTSGDKRIVAFHQKNSGVSSARNLALNNMKGDYFCFLDADDWLPPHSIALRLEKFSESVKIGFVDGCVQVYDEAGKRIEKTWKPSFSGNPKKALLRLSEECFFGPTWMFRNQNRIVGFRQDMTHGEDLMFNVDNSTGEYVYAFVSDPLYCYRNRSGSAMKDIDRLIEGYKILYRKFREHDEFDFFTRQIYLYKTIKISVLLSLRFGRIGKTIRQIFTPA